MRGLRWALVLALTATAVQAQPQADRALADRALAGRALAEALRGGGYVLLMRHASSPRTLPGPGEADPGNPHRERQLDEAGKRAAEAMGQAIKVLRLPIGEVWSSPTYRALETVRLAGLPSPHIAPELGDGGQSMQAAGAAQADWLKAKVGTPPRAGADTVIVTHLPNISAAYGPAAAGLGDGEALVFHPNGQAPPEPVARIRIEDWPALAAEAGR